MNEYATGVIPKKKKSCSTGGCGCSSENGAGCNKLNVYDWLADIPLSVQDYQYVQVAFDSGSRKDFYINKAKIELFNGQWVTVESGGGFDVGRVALKGWLAMQEIRRNKIDVHDKENPMLSLLHISTDAELEQHHRAKTKEPIILAQARDIIEELKLEMKLAKVDLQSDEKKIIFYYTSQERIDYRELIKRYAYQFKAKIEMKQIHSRKESAMVGGIGSCGRELCCSTWLPDQPNVNIAAARYQELSINTAKLNGQCGRLKCCLNYELNMYLEILKEFPENIKKIALADDSLKLIKRDLFKKLMTFEASKSEKVICLKVSDVKKIMSKKYSIEEVLSMDIIEKQETVKVAKSEASLEF